VLGRALLPLLLESGHSVRALSRHPVSPALGVESAAGDLLTSDLSPIVDGCEAVVHAATAIPSNPSLPGAWDRNTELRTLGTQRLIAASEAMRVRRYVQQSIIMAYADGGDAWLDEHAPFDASPARASTVAPVREMESLVRASSLNWCILRGGQFAGPGTSQDALLSALSSRTATLPCGGAYFISPVHPADMAAAVVAAALSATAAHHTTFNIVSEPLRYADYLDRLAEHVNRPAASVDRLTSLRPLPPPRRDASRPCPPSHRCTAAAAHQHLAWHPTHSIWPETR
jgi:nucleoside-diphosphate-sugar epimerase